MKHLLSFNKSTHLLVESLPRALPDYSVFFSVFSPLFSPPSLGSGSSSLKTKRHHRVFYQREGGINKRLYRKDGARTLPLLIQVFVTSWVFFQHRPSCSEASSPFRDRSLVIPAKTTHTHGHGLIRGSLWLYILKKRGAGGFKSRCSG